ncbi:MAG: 2'-deoxycytidine 5'-triphosphate deaminase [Alphaproteobacteria bacterium]
MANDMTMPETATTELNGILPMQSLRAYLRDGAIAADTDFDDDQVQPASIDLRLGRVAHRVRASFLPGAERTVAQQLDRLGMHTIDLADGAVLERGCVYIVPLMERLKLPPRVAGVANPKSSSGRLDIFTRLITDRAIAFDRIDSGYEGPLYAEIAPRTFSVLVKSGTRLSQLRLRKGRSRCTDVELRRLHERVPLVHGASADDIAEGIAISVDLHGAGGDAQKHAAETKDGRVLLGAGGGAQQHAAESKDGRVLLGAARDKLIGFKARPNTALIDVQKAAHYDPLDFWEPLYARGDEGLILNPDDFYILASREAVTIPPDHAAEMVPYDTLVGEFRVHYAGFFDPGFGYAPAGGQGTRAVLEIRSHEVPFLLEHGQIVGRLLYEKMTAQPERLYGPDMGSNYQRQTLALSKQFRRVDWSAG